MSFDLRLGPGARRYHQWREYPGRPYFDTGPSFHIVDKQLTAAGRTLMTLPEGQWVHVEVEAGHGDQADDTWRLTVQTLLEAERHQELGVGLGLAHPIPQRLHGLDRVHLV